MSHPDLDPSAQNRLQSIVLGTAPRSSDPTPGHVTSEPDGGPGRRARLVRRVREATRPVAEPALDRLASVVAGRLRHSMRSEYNYLVAAVELMRAEQTALLRELDGTAAFGASTAAHRLDSLEINLELMKGQIGAFQSTLDDFGNAIAPTAGLGGVPHRFAELRVRSTRSTDRYVQPRALRRPR